MATVASQAWPALAPEQQRLLLAALTSNKKRKSDAAPAATSSASAGLNSGDKPSMSGVDPTVFSNPSSDSFAMTSAAPSSFDLNATDSAFDVDFSKSLGDFTEPFPDYANANIESEQREKRKNVDFEDDDEDDQNDDRSGEPEAKEAKKPGRKLLTSEPTTKRKAQNRAAQRAFRERKEKHLKDLETKVYDLEKASESANHENSVLRAQVERLQDELKDYRRKVSLSNKSPTSNRPSLDGSRSFGASGLDFDFNFDFPKFGGVPGSVMPSTQAITGSFSQPQQSTTSRGSFDDPVTNGLSSHHNSMSSKSNDRSQSASNGNQSNGGGSLFGTGFFDIMRSSNTGASPQPMNNSTNGASPTHTCSTSSHSPTSHNGNGASSSCCTSPDPVDWTNIYKFNKKPCAQYHKNGSIDGPNFTNMNTPGLTNAKTPNSDSLSFDFIANQNGGQFDPVLFGDYRDAHNAIVGDDAFTGGFFEDGVSFPDLGNDAFFNLTADTTTPARAPTTGALNQIQQQKPTHYKPTLLDQVAQQQEGNYAGVLKDKDLPVPQTEDYSSPNLMTCHKIWNQLQNCPRFKSGDFDVDSLCAELSAKAKCTETGVAVPKEAVEAALWKLAGNPFSCFEDKEQKERKQETSQTNGSSAADNAVKAEATRRFEMFMAST